MLPLIIVLQRGSSVIVVTVINFGCRLQQQYNHRDESDDDDDVEDDDCY